MGHHRAAYASGITVGIIGASCPSFAGFNRIEVLARSERSTLQRAYDHPVDHGGGDRQGDADEGNDTKQAPAVKFHRIVVERL